MRRWISWGLVLALGACQPAPPSTGTPGSPPSALSGRRALDQAAIMAGSRGWGCWPAALVATAGGYWFSARAPGRIYRVEHDAFIGSSSVDQDVALEGVTRIGDVEYLLDADRQMILAYRRGQEAEAVTRSGDMVGTDVRPGSSPDGTMTAQALLDSPMAIAAMPDGALLVTETALGRIRRLVLGGTIQTLVDGLVTPTSLAVAPDGSVVVVEAGTGRVRRWRAGAGWQELAADLPYPDGVAVDRDGAVWVTGIGEGQLLSIRPDGVRQVHQVPGLQDPGPVADSESGLLLIDRADSSIWQIAPPSTTAGR